MRLRTANLASAAPYPDIVPSGGWRRTGPSPTRSDPEGSSRNEFRSGRLSSLPPGFTSSLRRERANSMNDSVEKRAADAPDEAEEAHRPDPATEPRLRSRRCARAARQGVRLSGAGPQIPPSVFEDLVGQEAMVRTLSNAFDAKPHRITPSCMTGVRGVGKTSTARIIARTLNSAQRALTSRSSPTWTAPASIATQSWDRAMST